MDAPLNLVRALPVSSSSRGFKRILVAIDGSESAREAARTAVDLARRGNASLFVLHVIPRPVLIEGPQGGIPTTKLVRQLVDVARKNAEGWIEEVVIAAKDEGVKVRGELVENIPSVVQTILDYSSEWKIDLIVVGTRGLTGFRKALLGSVSSGVLSHSPCSVLVVRQGASG